MQVPGPGHPVACLNGRLVSNPAQASILDYLIEAISKEKGESRERLGQLMNALAERKKLLDIIRNDIKAQARTSAWLLVHVPVTFGLIASLIAHVVSVFVYW